jgi:hypothetical protein
MGSQTLGKHGPKLEISILIVPLYPKRITSHFFLFKAVTACTYMHITINWKEF